MKKRTIATLVVLALFALTMAAFAYTKTSNVVAEKSCCCKSGDSCPMKSKDDKGGEHSKMSCCKKHGDEHAKAEGHSCCGDSCPMKKGEKSATANASADDTHSCCGCCGDSCPMKKDGATATSATDGKSCCDDCDCCKDKDKGKTSV
ncbi:MAG TPA: hypothetical protein VJV05_09660 [Pyrinomonadaceae bacterium]|nr:hypothetical protein [Pyrinomonadaceae bacterium]